MVIAACGGTAGNDTTTAAGGDTAAETTAATADTTAAAETTAATETTGADGTETTAAPSETTAGVAPEGDPIVLGASLPLTGEFSIAGTKHADGYQFCVDELNAHGGILGRPVELLVEDNRSDTEATVNQTQRFISVEGVDALLGTFSSLLGFPASTVAEQNGMVYPIPSSGALRLYERGYENIFYFQALPAELTGATIVDLVEYYEEQGVIPERPQTAAIVNADDFFAAAISNGLLGGTVEIPDSGEIVDLAPGFLAEMDIEVVFEEVWPIGYTDWLTLANSIRSADADMLAVSTASPDEAIALTQALQTVGYQAPLVYMSQGAQTEFQEALGDAANGIITHSVWSPLANFEGVLAGEPYTNQDFIDGFTESFGTPPDEDEAIPFAVCQGIAQAMEGTGGTDNAAMSQWLHDRTAEDPVRTIMGTYSWDERGLADNRAFLVNQWQEGELEFVYPIGEFEGTTDLLFPKPEW
ncbi:MAG: ABC transporter substrate-binding protein [Acidimicrobiia bacterium]|nr:ABC transporter substrate-binding protein [Acidimicrobiia bacterium]